MHRRRLTICKVVCFNEKKIAALHKKLPSRSKPESAAHRYTAPGHPARHAILHVLSLDECCVCDLANVLGRPVSTVSQRLRMFMSAEFPLSRQEGKPVFYMSAYN